MFAFSFFAGSDSAIVGEASYTKMEQSCINELQSDAKSNKKLYYTLKRMSKKEYSQYLDEYLDKCASEERSSEESDSPVDNDSDGFTSDIDCNDLDDDINPAAEDIAMDGIDQDCDGMDSDTIACGVIISVGETFYLNGTEFYYGNSTNATLPNPTASFMNLNLWSTIVRSVTYPGDGHHAMLSISYDGTPYWFNSTETPYWSGGVNYGIELTSPCYS